MTFKISFSLLSMLLLFQLGLAQSPLVTKNSVTSFFSHAPLEDIEAVNNKTSAALDFNKNEVVVKMLIKHFEFEKALMQEHFNENYMESEKYPSAVFKGKFTSTAPIDINVNNTYKVDVAGELTIHGVSKLVNCEGTITVMDQQITASTKFLVKPNDYKIKIPSLVIKNIAEEIEVTSILSFEKSDNLK